MNLLNKVRTGRLFSHAQIDTGLANSGTLTYLIRTPAAGNTFFACELHVNLKLDSQALIELVQAPGGGSDGTEIDPVPSHYRFSTPPVSPVQLFTGTTHTGGTTLKQSLYFPGGAKASQDQPFMLGAGVDYLLRLTNNSGSSGAYSFGVDFWIASDQNYLTLKSERE